MAVTTTTMMLDCGVLLGASTVNDEVFDEKITVLPGAAHCTLPPNAAKQIDPSLPVLIQLTPVCRHRDTSPLPPWPKQTTWELLVQALTVVAVGTGGLAPTVTVAVG